MKKIMFTLSVLFVVLTFVGAGYVLYNAGSVNAGYAVIPMVLALESVSLFIVKQSSNPKKYQPPPVAPPSRKSETVSCFSFAQNEVVNHQPIQSTTGRRKPLCPVPTMI